MSTAAQQKANRENAQKSTGPRTTEGKAASSQNSTRWGLYAVELQVREDEAEPYNTLRNEMLNKYRPEGILEECLFLEIVNAQWRLMRCTAAERAIKPLQNEADLVHDFANPAQTAINRARAAAKNSMKRDIAAYQELQAERFQRAEMLTEGPIHPDSLGMVPLRKAIAPTLTQIEQARIAIRADNQRLARAAATQSPDLQNEASSSENLSEAASGCPSPVSAPADLCPAA